MTQTPKSPAEPDVALPSDDDAPLTAEQQRARTEGANRNLALLLVGGAVLMLAAVFGVVLVVTAYG